MSTGSRRPARLHSRRLPNLFHNCSRTSIVLVGLRRGVRRCVGQTGVRSVTLNKARFFGQVGQTAPRRVALGDVALSHAVCLMRADDGSPLSVSSARVRLLSSFFALGPNFHRGGPRVPHGGLVEPCSSGVRRLVRGGGIMLRVRAHARLMEPPSYSFPVFQSPCGRPALSDL